MANFPTKAQRFDAVVKEEIKAEIDPKVLLSSVTEITDPSTATATDVADKVNEILTALKGS